MEGRAKSKVLDVQDARTENYSRKQGKACHPFTFEDGKIAKGGKSQCRSKVDNTVQLD
jgi:hypothetical protein